MPRTKYSDVRQSATRLICCCLNNKYMYVYIYRERDIDIYIYRERDIDIYTYIYIEREREGDVCVCINVCFWAFFVSTGMNTFVVVSYHDQFRSSKRISTLSEGHLARGTERTCEVGYDEYSRVQMISELVAAIRYYKIAWDILSW